VSVGAAYQAARRRLRIPRGTDSIRPLRPSIRVRRGCLSGSPPPFAHTTRDGFYPSPTTPSFHGVGVGYQPTRNLFSHHAGRQIAVPYALRFVSVGAAYQAARILFTTPRGTADCRPLRALRSAFVGAAYQAARRRLRIPRGTDDIRPLRPSFRVRRGCLSFTPRVMHPHPARYAHRRKGVSLAFGLLRSMKTSGFPGVRLPTLPHLPCVRGGGPPSGGGGVVICAGGRASLRPCRPAIFSHTTRDGRLPSLRSGDSVPRDYKKSSLWGVNTSSRRPASRQVTPWGSFGAQ